MLTKTFSVECRKGKSRKQILRPQRNWNAVKNILALGGVQFLRPQVNYFSVRSSSIFEHNKLNFRIYFAKAVRIGDAHYKNTRSWRFFFGCLFVYK